MATQTTGTEEQPTDKDALKRQLHGGRVRSGVEGDKEELLPLATSPDFDLDIMSTEEPNFTPSGTKAEKTEENGYVNGIVYSDDESKEISEKDIMCGFRKCKPERMQLLCNNPKALLMFLCLFSMSQGFVVNGINNVNTTTVEKRFQLPSSRVGMISSSYDLSAAILGILISFYGSGRSKARWLSAAAVAMAIGSFIMSLPHFTTGLYMWGHNVTLACKKEDQPSVCDSESNLQNYLYVLILGQLLHGLGGTTLYTVGVGLIDDSVPATSSPFYIGIMYAFATLGPALGYIIGGQLLDVYVDFDKVTRDSVSLTPEDPRWVGAWWVGFLIAFLLFLLAAVPLVAYGKELPTAKHVRETRISQAHGGDGTMVKSIQQRGRTIKVLPIALWNLLKIPPFFAICLAGASEGLITAGFATFMPKFIQNQFGVTAGWASMLTGFMAVPGAAGGQFFGGYISKRFKLKVKGCLRFAMLACSLVIVLSSALWAHCDNELLAGVTTHYPNSSNNQLPSLNHACNTDCNCHTELYEPVCDSNQIQYFSPCHAGCQTFSKHEQTYSQCHCLSGGGNSTVKVGKCGSDCHLLYVFLPLVFIIIFFTFTPSPPAVSATLRCIHDSQRTLGLGMKWFIVRLLGTVPGPIFFGAVIDSTCLIWREKCEDRASCWIYDNNQMSRNFFIIIICVKVISIISFFIAHQVYKPPPEKNLSFMYNKETELVSEATASTTCTVTGYGKDITGIEENRTSVFSELERTKDDVLLTDPENSEQVGYTSESQT